MLPTLRSTAYTDTLTQIQSCVMCADALWLVNALQWEVVESNALHATLLQLQPGWRTVGVDIWWRRHLAVAVGEW